jgi:mannose-6-phosphate isomerase-like protein (cupin superfamily)
MMRPALWTVLAAFLLPAVVGAQTAPPPQTPTAAGSVVPKPQAPPPPKAAAGPSAAGARVSASIMVTDQSGGGIGDVGVTMTGPVERGGATGRDGTLRLQGLRAGTYRLRFESPDFITLERDVTIKVGAPAEIDVALDRVPPKPKAPEPEPAPAPAPAAGRAPVAVDPHASVDLVPLPDWIERNLIGRGDSIKETQVGKTPVATATVVQVREPLKDRVRNDADEMLYVIAGEGVMHAKGRDLALDAGSLVVVPRGVGYTLERRGRNPLIALSIVGK